MPLTVDEIEAVFERSYAEQCAAPDRLDYVRPAKKTALKNDKLGISPAALTAIRSGTGTNHRFAAGYRPAQPVALPPTIHGNLSVMAALAECPYEPTAEENEWLALQEATKTRGSALLDYVRNRSGEEMEIPSWQKAMRSRVQMDDDSIFVADCLHQGGEKGHKPHHAPRGAILDLLTGMAMDLPHVAAKNFIPVEAARKRARMLISTEYWLEQHKDDRFLVFHGPGRITVETLNAVIKHMQRKLSKLNGEKWLKALGIRFTLRITEIGGLTFNRIRSTGEKIEFIGTPTRTGKVQVRLYGRKGHRYVDRNEIEVCEHRNEQGAWTYYPHINVLVHLEKGRLHNLPKGVQGPPAPGSWSHTLMRLHDAWEWGFKECGGLEDIREAIKYCAKPADLRRMSPDDICDLARAMFRLHLAQPLGPLRKQNSHYRKECMKFVRWKAGDKMHIRIKPDWNARKRNRYPDAEAEREKAEKKRRQEARDALKKRKDTARYDGMTETQADFVFEGAYGATTIAMPAPKESKSDIRRAETAATPPPMRNRVIARMVGMSPFTPRIGPQVLVFGFEHTAEAYAAVCALPFVEPMLTAAGLSAAQVEAAKTGIAPLKVHTSAVTVRQFNHPPPPIQKVMPLAVKIQPVEAAN